MAESDTPALAEHRSMLVLAECGHWWRETQPKGLRLRPDAPRVCSICRPTHPAAVGTSPQGMAMVPVHYLPGDILEREA